MNHRSISRRCAIAGSAAAAALTAALPLSTHAAPGDPVASYGNDGLAVVSEGTPPTYDLGADAVRLNDGSLIMAGTAFSGQVGDIVVSRVGPDRRLDGDFGTNGRLRISRGGRTMLALGIARHGTGVVVVGISLRLTGSDEEVVVVKVTADGRLDTSFDGDGIRFVDVGDEADFRSIAVDTTGRIAVGGFADDAAQVLMLTSTGALDTTFSGDGVLDLPAVTPGSSVLPIAFQSDRRLVVAGTTPSLVNVADTWVGRFTTSGAPDVSFDGDGQRTVDVGGVEDRPRAIVVSAGRVYVAGRSGAAVGLLALTTSGLPDPGFSGDGQVVLPSGGTASEPVDITIVPATGALHVASQVIVAGGDRGWELSETSSTGVWNPTFVPTGNVIEVLDGEGRPHAVMTDGATTTLVGDDAGDMAIVDVAVDDVVDVPGTRRVHRVNLARMASFVDLEGSTVFPDGRVVSVGTVRTGMEDDDVVAVLVGLRADGRRDRSFGSAGAVRLPHAGGGSAGIDVVSTPAGGSLVLVGTRGPANSGYVVHARAADGRRSPGFGTNGRTTLPIANDIEAATSGAITRDARGRIHVAVARSAAGNWSTSIVRLQANGALDTTFGTGGIVDVASTSPTTPQHIEVLRNGRVVVVDSTRVIRLRANGSPDTSFDTDGVLSPVPGVSAPIGAADVQADGRVVLASPGPDVATVVRLTSRGLADPTFGSGSPVVLATGELFAGGVYDLVAQPDGRIAILVFGLDGDATSAPVVWRLRYSGAIDTSFGTAGSTAVDAPGLETVGRSLDRGSDGDLYVTGAFYDPVPYGMVARLDGGRGARCAGRPATVHLLTGERPTRRDDVVIGTPGADSVAAERGDDIVCGRGGDDVLRGGPGADRLVGGPGADTLVGGSGRDRCVGGQGTDSAVGCERVRQVP